MQSMMTRRRFVEFGLAAGVCCGVHGGLAKQGGAVRFGIISDTHVTGPESVKELAGAFAFLRDKGVDAVIHCGDMTDFGYLHQLEAFAEALLCVKRDVRYCSVCGNFTEGELCDVCLTRDKSVVCVVKEPKDVIAVEKTHEFKGVYHVLHGTISPTDGIGPENLRMKELVARLEDSEVKEIIMATNSTVEGDATAMYISRLLKPIGIRVTRLAYGIPVGGELEYADKDTLARAIDGRRDM